MLPIIQQCCVKCKLFISFIDLIFFFIVCNIRGKFKEEKLYLRLDFHLESVTINSQKTIIQKAWRKVKKNQYAKC